MSWVRLDDVMPEHPKVLRAGPVAFALHVAAICWSNRLLTDGFIPAERLPGLLGGSDGTANQLVRAGLWEPCDDGWCIHDYLDFQPAADDIRAKRERDAARKRGGPRKASARNPRGVAADSKAPNPNPTEQTDPDVTPLNFQRRARADGGGAG